jgi:hypothetical protein
MVEFSESMTPASDEQIAAVERRVGLSFPLALRRIFREANGGRPYPYVYRDDNNDTDVSECLAIREGQGSALWTYELLVLSKHLVPAQYFPFAVDSGGDCFLVDCSPGAGGVWTYVHDTAFEHLRFLCESLDEFWSRLVVA